MVNGRPRVFVSSTIYDFRDLRSSIKYWLEEAGFDVLMSEHNDFPKRPDDNSYNACLEAIQQAHYFLLLIGERAGGWYDARNQISITRQEYRIAREAFLQTGSPKLLAFVRQEIWDLREDRRGLTKLLKREDSPGAALSQEQKDHLTNHESRLIADAASIFEFLREVGQNDQMIEAAAGKGPLPQANWIHRFASFSDIASALKIAMGITHDISAKVLVCNLRRELALNLAQLLSVTRDRSVVPWSWWGRRAVDAMTGDPSDFSEIEARHLVNLGIFSTALHPSLSRLFIERALLLGTFLQYDANDKDFVATSLHEALAELNLLIERLHATKIDYQDAISLMHEFKGRNEEKVKVANLRIAPMCGRCKVVARITQLSRAIFKALSEDQQELLDLPDWSAAPFPGEAEKIAEERVSFDELIRWLGNEVGAKIL